MMTLIPQFRHVLRRFVPQSTSSAQPEFTARAVFIGLAIGCLICFTNLSLGLQSGWISMCVLRLLVVIVSQTIFWFQDVHSVCSHWFSDLEDTQNTHDTSRDYRSADNCRRHGDHATCSWFCRHPACSWIVVGKKRRDTTYTFVMARRSRVVVLNSIFWVSEIAPLLPLDVTNR